MSWHYSPALVAAYSAANCSGGEPYAPLSMNPTPEAYYWPDKTTGHSRLSRFGMTSEHLTEDRGADVLTWFLAGFRAKTSAQPVPGQDSTVNEAASGTKWPASLTRYDHDSRSWKTHQYLLLGGLDEFSETWPKCGSMRDGECWEQTTWARPTDANESGLWPTPTCGGGGQTLPEGTTPTGKTPDGRKQTVSLERYAIQVERNLWPTPTAITGSGGASLCKWGGSGAREKLKQMVTPEELNGRLNPEWVEWLMGWPIGWTDCTPLATDRFHEWLQQHGKH